MDTNLIPFTAEDYLDGIHALGVLPENETRRRFKPRASGLNDCARQQAYYMHNIPRTNKAEEDKGRRDHKVTAELGRMAEDLSVKAVTGIASSLISPEADGIAIRNRQVSLPDTACVTGHPDGEIHQFKRGGTNEPTQYAEELFDDKRWGFEHKLFGRYSYLKLFKLGLFKGAPNIISQVVLYGYYLGWDAVTVVALSQDASSMRGERTTSLRLHEKGKTVETRNRHAWATRDDWNPKVLVYNLPSLSSFYDGFMPSLTARAEALTAVEDPDAVVREADPGDSKPFPCNYCDWKDRCIAAGPGSMLIPVSPLQED